MKRITVFELLLVFLIEMQTAKRLDHQRVILISLDGFRWDFRLRFRMPNLRELVEKGVTADQVLNVFPTNTFPNHYTLVTGLYPEHHGIMDNEMFEPSFTHKTHAVFDMGNTDSDWWNEAEPIWVTNQRQGHESAVCFWPGYDVEIRGVLPKFSTSQMKFSKPFVDKNKLMSPKGKVDAVINWIQKNKGVNFVALYSSEPDLTSHDIGPDYKDRDRLHKLSEALLKVDKMIGYLMDRLKETHNLDNMNIIIIGELPNEPSIQITRPTKFLIS